VPVPCGGHFHWPSLSAPLCGEGVRREEDLRSEADDGTAERFHYDEIDLF